jgi:hypothetical protein
MQGTCGHQIKRCACTRLSCSCSAHPEGYVAVCMHATCPDCHYRRRIPAWGVHPIAMPRAHACMHMALPSISVPGAGGVPVHHGRCKDVQFYQQIYLTSIVSTYLHYICRLHIPIHSNSYLLMTTSLVSNLSIHLRNYSSAYSCFMKFMSILMQLFIL